jgi:hypothetical protein
MNINDDFPFRLWRKLGPILKFKIDIYITIYYIKMKAGFYTFLSYSLRLDIIGPALSLSGLKSRLGLDLRG